MAAASFFLKGLKKLVDGDIDLSVDSFKVAILNAGYTFNKDTEFFDTGLNDANDPSSHILTATSYAHQDVTGALSTFLIEAGDGKVGLAINDVSFGVIGGAANDTMTHVILFKDTGVATTSPVLAYIPITTPAATSGITVILDFNTTGEGGQLRIALPSQAGS